MASNSFTKTLAEMVFSTAKRPGRYLASFLQTKLDKEFQKIYFEQMMFQGAFLAKCKGPLVDYEAISKVCNDMSLEEHRIFVNGEYIEQTYKILLALHEISRNIQVIYDPTKYSTSTAIFDPNSFPIHTS